MKTPQRPWCKCSMQRAEALSLCAFSQPSAIGASQVGAVSHLSEHCDVKFDVQLACPLCPWRTLNRKRKTIGAALRRWSRRQLILRCQWRETAEDGHVLVVVIPGRTCTARLFCFVGRCVRVFHHTGTRQIAMFVLFSMETARGS